MKKKISLTICIAIIAINVSGCVLINIGNLGSITARGNHEIYEINVGSYKAIKITGACDIRYYSAPSDTVTLAIQSNVREYYIIEVINYELIVRTTRNISFGSDNIPVLTISTPSLNKMNLSGAGTLTTYDKMNTHSFDMKMNGAYNGNAEFDVERLSVEIAGAAKIDLSGRADTANFRLLGASEVNAFSLQTQNAAVDLAGAGTIRISCSDELTINASGASTIEYRGSPRINQNISGAVRVRQVN
jgi:hypothetical protein